MNEQTCRPFIRDFFIEMGIDFETTSGIAISIQKERNVAQWFD